MEVNVLRMLIEVNYFILTILSVYCGVMLLREWKAYGEAAPWFKLTTWMMIGYIIYWPTNLIIAMQYIPILPEEKEWVVILRSCALVIPTVILIFASILVTKRHAN